MSDTTLPGSVPETLRIDYVPRPGLLRLTLVNTLLWVVTLTVYRFWARSNVRRHVWSSVHVNGQPLEYTGKGSELFKGALIVFFVLLLPVGLIVAGVSAAYGPDHPAVAGLQSLIFLVFSLLWGAAIFKARRYQMSRTQWRGIRGGLEGSATVYSLTYFGSLLARGITLGWSTPVMNVNLQEQMTDAMRFGDRKFRFRGRAGPLYPSYALCWFLTLFFLIGGVVFIVWLTSTFQGGAIGQQISDFFELEPRSTDGNPALGYFIIAMGLLLVLTYFVFYPAVWAIYTAREIAQFANYTTFDGAQFRIDATAWSLIGLAVGNFLLLVFTLGIAQPFVLQRTVRYLCDRMTIEGAIDVDAIRQSQQPLEKTGEGLADAFDVSWF